MARKHATNTSLIMQTHADVMVHTHTHTNTHVHTHTHTHVLKIKYILVLFHVST